MTKIKLVLSIRSLDIGGAERQFIELVKNIDKNIFETYVCVMYPGKLDREVKKVQNVKFINFNKKGRYDFIFYFKYKNFLNKIKPDVIYSFLGEMNLFSYWAKPKNTKLIWGFRASNMELSKYGKLPQMMFWLQKIYSGNVNKIIANSYVSVVYHRDKGFDMSKSKVVHNGIDINRFQKKKDKREEFRTNYNLRDTDIAIGMVARIDYMKGYIIFTQAAKKLLDKYRNIKFFFVGDGNQDIKEECEKILDTHNNRKFFWLGSVKEVENVYSGLDIYVSSSSFGEGFSNSIAEAMSCELPCIVTDVGDSKIIVNNTGIVIAPNDVDALSKGVERMIQKNYRILGKIARKKIIRNFSIKKMVKKTEKIIYSLVK